MFLAKEKKRKDPPIIDYTEHSPALIANLSLSILGVHLSLLV